MGNKQCCGASSQHVLEGPKDGARRPTKHKKEPKRRQSRFNSESGGGSTILYMPPELVENNRAALMNEETLPSFADSAA